MYIYKYIFKYILSNNIYLKIKIDIKQIIHVN